MSLGRLGAMFRPPPADQYPHDPTPRLAVWSFHFDNTPACEAAVSFPIVAFPCTTSSRPLGLATVGWGDTTPFTTPCVGPCTVDAERAGPTYPQVTMPLAVVVQDQQGKRHCQEIQP